MYVWVSLFVVSVERQREKEEKIKKAEDQKRARIEAQNSEWSKREKHELLKWLQILGTRAVLSASDWVMTSSVRTSRIALNHMVLCRVCWRCLSGTGRFGDTKYRSGLAKKTERAVADMSNKLMAQAYWMVELRRRYSFMKTRLSAQLFTELLARPVKDTAAAVPPASVPASSSTATATPQSKKRPRTDADAPASKPVGGATPVASKAGAKGTPAAAGAKSAASAVTPAGKSKAGVTAAVTPAKAAAGQASSTAAPMEITVRCVFIDSVCVCVCVRVFGAIGTDLMIIWCVVYGAVVGVQCEILYLWILRRGSCHDRLR